jgi:hypothetical protein
MLARIWTPPEATSIWVQIVAERKREIEKTLDEENEVNKIRQQPDMVVLGSRPQTIRMDDSLIKAGGCVTVGLLSDSPKKHDGVYWSLSLANFRYYGDPVSSTRSAGSDASRITFDQLWIVTLGSLLQSWKNFDNDHVAGARFIVALWNNIEQATHGKLVGTFAFPLPMWTCPWLRPLANAATLFLELENLERETVMMLFGLGKISKANICSQCWGRYYKHRTGSLQNDEQRCNGCTRS